MLCDFEFVLYRCVKRNQSTYGKCVMGSRRMILNLLCMYVVYFVYVVIL